MNITLTETLAYNPQEWSKGYDSQPEEFDYLITTLEGEIPPTLQGTLYRNGPGLLDIGGIPIRHPFDGDGMISAVTFKNSQAWFKNRFIQTQGYIEEKEAKKPLYRGVFGTAKLGGWLSNAFDVRLKNIANTNVISWGNKLLALWEADVPYRLQSDSLETLGLDYLDGVLQPGDSFSAHPRIDPNCIFDNGQPCLVNFGLKTGLSTTLNLWEFAPDGKLLREQKHEIKGFAFIHDFAITPHYAIFFQNPVTFNPFPFLLGFKGAGECVGFNPKEKTKIIIIPRDPNSQKKPYILETHSGFVFHHSNAFEADSQTICIDSICYNEFPKLEKNETYKTVDFQRLAPGQLWRFTLSLKTHTVKSMLLNERCVEFPSIHPQWVGKNARYSYMGATHFSTGNAPLQALCKFDLETKEEQIYSFSPSGYVSEPIFVPFPDGKTEEEGWVLVMVYDGKQHRSSIAIFDAENISKGYICRLHLTHHIPYGLHGCFLAIS